MTLRAAPDVEVSADLAETTPGDVSSDPPSNTTQPTTSALTDRAHPTPDHTMTSDITRNRARRPQPRACSDVERGSHIEPLNICSTKYPHLVAKIRNLHGEEREKEVRWLNEESEESLTREENIARLKSLAHNLDLDSSFMTAASKSKTTHTPLNDADGFRSTTRRPGAEATPRQTRSMAQADPQDEPAPPNTSPIVPTPLNDVSPEERDDNRQPTPPPLSSPADLLPSPGRSASPAVSVVPAVPRAPEPTDVSTHPLPMSAPTYSLPTPASGEHVDDPATRDTPAPISTPERHAPVPVAIIAAADHSPVRQRQTLPPPDSQDDAQVAPPANRPATALAPLAMDLSGTPAWLQAQHAILESAPITPDMYSMWNEIISSWVALEHALGFENMVRNVSRSYERRLKAIRSV